MFWRIGNGNHQNSPTQASKVPSFSFPYTDVVPRNFRNLIASLIRINLLCTQAEISYKSIFNRLYSYCADPSSKLDLVDRNIIHNNNDLSCYTKRYINNLIDYIEKYFNRKIDREKIFISLNNLWDILEEYESPERWVDSAHVTQKKRYGIDFRDELATVLNELWSERINISNPNYIDIVKYINNDLPIYEIGSTLRKLR